MFPLQSYNCGCVQFGAAQCCASVMAAGTLQTMAVTLLLPSAAPKPLAFRFTDQTGLTLSTKGPLNCKKVDRRDVHPNPLRVSSGIVPSGPRVSDTEPSRSCLHLQRNLVRPLSLTEELRLCQNIEHYQLSILMSRAPGIHPPARCPRSVHED
jgi:hypothetical protein